MRVIVKIEREPDNMLDYAVHAEWEFSQTMSSNPTKDNVEDLEMKFREALQRMGIK